MPRAEVALAQWLWAPRRYQWSDGEQQGSPVGVSRTALALFWGNHAGQLQEAVGEQAGLSRRHPTLGCPPALGRMGLVSEK